MEHTNKLKTIKKNRIDERNASRKKYKHQNYMRDTVSSLNKKSIPTLAIPNLERTASFTTRNLSSNATTQMSKMSPMRRSTSVSQRKSSFSMMSTCSYADPYGHFGSSEYGIDPYNHFE